MSTAAIPVVILCGGRGILIDQSGTRVNKALVRIKGEPMVAHVMRGYVAAGFRRFILAAGAQREALCDMLRAGYGGDPAGDGGLILPLDGASCRVRVVDTGADSTTGDRLRLVMPHLDHPSLFAVTYSDTLSDVDIGAMLAFHRRHGKRATVMATQLPTRFRILGLRQGDTLVRGFLDRALIENDPINGGFYLFDQAVLGERYLGNPQPGLVLETTVIERLVEDRELMAYSYAGGWHYLDAERDIPLVTAVADKVGGAVSS